MSKFTYKVKDRSGQTVEGTMVGEDRRAVVARLQESGNYIMEVREVRSLSESVNPFSLFVRWIINPIFGGATIGQLTVFYRQFASMLKAGMSLSQTMTGLCTRGGSRTLRKASEDMLAVITEGGPLSEAMKRHPALFPDLHIALIRAAEAGGTLDVMAGKIADYMERENKVRNRLRFATLYPKILVLAVIFIPSLPTLILEGFQPYLHQTMSMVVPILVWLAGIWVTWKLINQIPQVRGLFDAVKLAVPKLGKMVRMLALAKFYRVLAAMYSAGTPLSSSIVYAADATGNQYLAAKLKHVCPWVERGQKLSAGLRNEQVLPDMALDLIVTGEQTGQLDEMLDKAADYTEQDADVLIFQSTMILSVVLILAVGGYIGSFVFKFWAGQYQNVLDYKE